MWLVALWLGCAPAELTEPPEGSKTFGFAGFNLWKTNGELVPLLKLNQADGYVPQKDEVFTFRPQIKEWPDAKVEGVCQIRAGRLRYCTWNFQAPNETLETIEKALVEAVISDPYDDLVAVEPTSNDIALRRYAWTLDAWSDIVVVHTREKPGTAVPFVGITYGRQKE